MSQIVESLCETAGFQPGDRVKTLRGSARGVIKQVLDDGRVVWQPEGVKSELIALPESLLVEKKSPRK
jgi:transcription elongation factor